MFFLVDTSQTHKIFLFLKPILAKSVKQKSPTFDETYYRNC